MHAMYVGKSTMQNRESVLLGGMQVGKYCSVVVSSIDADRARFRKDGGGVSGKQEQCNRSEGERSLLNNTAF